MTTHDELFDRIHRGVMDPGADLELLAHETAASIDGHTYLVQLLSTLVSLAPGSPAVARAESLLEQSALVAAELDRADAAEAAAEGEQEAGRGS